MHRLSHRGAQRAAHDRLLKTEGSPPRVFLPEGSRGLIAEGNRLELFERDRSVGHLAPLFGQVKPRLPSLRVIARLGLLRAIARVPSAKVNDPHREPRVEQREPPTRPRPGRAVQPIVRRSERGSASPAPPAASPPCRPDARHSSPVADIPRPCADNRGHSSRGACSIPHPVARTNRRIAGFLGVFVTQAWHNPAGAANPKFAPQCRESDCELRVRSGTRIIESLVSLEYEVS
jgi:hypothetical protein